MKNHKTKFLLGGIVISIATLALAMPPTGDSTDQFDRDDGCSMMGGRMGMMNQGMMGSGMMGQGRKGMGMMGSGMMHGWNALRGEGPWSDFNYDRKGELLEPLSKEKAEKIAQYYLNTWDNPRLKIGKITEKEKVFEVEIVTKDKSLVDKILIEKNSGWLYPAKD